MRKSPKSRCYDSCFGEPKLEFSLLRLSRSVPDSLILLRHLSKWKIVVHAVIRPWNAAWTNLHPPIIRWRCSIRSTSKPAEFARSATSLSLIPSATSTISLVEGETVGTTTCHELPSVENMVRRAKPSEEALELGHNVLINPILRHRVSLRARLWGLNDIFAKKSWPWRTSSWWDSSDASFPAICIICS